MAVEGTGGIVTVDDVLSPSERTRAQSERMQPGAAGRFQPERGLGRGLPAVFLDKDGTLLENVPYSVDPRLMVFSPGASEALSLLAGASYPLVVVSNQSGVARGYFAEEALVAVEDRLREMVREAAGVELLDFLYCPHHPDGVVPAYSIACPCRKPRPGLLYQAAARHGLDLTQSWLIGDILDDVEAGKRAGCRTVMVCRGAETEWILTPRRSPDCMVAGLLDAARFIVDPTLRTVCLEVDERPACGG